MSFISEMMEINTFRRDKQAEKEYTNLYRNRGGNLNEDTQ